MSQALEAQSVMSSAPSKWILCLMWTHKHFKHTSRSTVHCGSFQNKKGAVNNIGFFNAIYVWYFWQFFDDFSNSWRCRGNLKNHQNLSKNHSKKNFYHKKKSMKLAIFFVHFYSEMAHSALCSIGQVV